jgi:hypothetical protein
VVETDGEQPGDESLLRIAPANAAHDPAPSILEQVVGIAGSGASLLQKEQSGAEYRWISMFRKLISPA